MLTQDEYKEKYNPSCEVYSQMIQNIPVIANLERIPIFELKDSGKREEFSTGAVRDVREDKGRFDLIPAYPLLRLAKLYEAGAKKYSEENWTRGLPIKRCLDSLLRHANSYKMGMMDEDHLSAVVFNAFAIIYFEEMIRQGKLPEELLMHKNVEGTK